jgi:hypothetical protein
MDDPIPTPLGHRLVWASGCTATQPPPLSGASWWPPCRTAASWRPLGCTTSPPPRCGAHLAALSSLLASQTRHIAKPDDMEQFSHLPALMVGASEPVSVQNHAVIPEMPLTFNLLKLTGGGRSGAPAGCPHCPTSCTLAVRQQSPQHPRGCAPSLRLLSNHALAPQQTTS